MQHQHGAHAMRARSPRYLSSVCLACPLYDVHCSCTVPLFQVQPYNFTRGEREVSFLTPTSDRVDLDAAGYATISLRMPTGTMANVTKLLIYSEDCPRFGQFGKGLSCRMCSEGVRALVFLCAHVYMCMIRWLLSWGAKVDLMVDDFF